MPEITITALTHAGEGVGRLEGRAVFVPFALPGETVLDKIYFSAFHATDFGERLEASGVDGLVFVGTVTEMCVEDSARHAVHFGYPTIVVRDAVSSNHVPSQQAMLDGFARNYGWVMTADEVLETLGLGEPATVQP